MRIAVIGGTGRLGAGIVAALREDGHEAVPLHRGNGVDAVTGRGLSEALAGCEVAVDALDHTTVSARRATAFFASAARSISEAARTAGVSRIVVVSIAGAADPEVHRRHGYYRGKAGQEVAYRSSPVPVTLVRSTQWFELVEQMVGMSAVGPVALLPTMRMAAVSADAVARCVARVAVEDAGESGLIHRAIRGPEEATGAELARRLLALEGSIGGKHPRWVAELPLFGRGVAGGGLLPADAVVDPTTLEEWAAARG